LVNEEVVEAPTSAGAFLIGDTHLAGQKDPPPWRVTYLIAGEQSRMISQQGLEDVLGRVWPPSGP